MSSDTVPTTFPSYVIAIPPFKTGDSGGLLIDESTFYVISATDGTPFLLLFRKRNLVRLFLEEINWDKEHQVVPVESEERVAQLILMLNERHGQATGVLIDPDGDLQGYPIPPETWLE